MGPGQQLKTILAVMKKGFCTTFCIGSAARLGGLIFFFFNKKIIINCFGDAAPFCLPVN